MATGQQQGGGLFAEPDSPELGPLTWTDMGGVHPDNPLVGGRGVPSGGFQANAPFRQVATGSPPDAAGLAAPGGEAPPMAGHWKELGNMKGNPLPWIMFAAIAYLGLTHLHASAGVKAGAGYG